MLSICGPSGGRSVAEPVSAAVLVPGEWRSCCCAEGEEWRKRGFGGG